MSEGVADRHAGRYLLLDRVGEGGMGPISASAPTEVRTRVTPLDPTRPVDTDPAPQPAEHARIVLGVAGGLVLAIIAGIIWATWPDPGQGSATSSSPSSSASITPELPAARIPDGFIAYDEALGFSIAVPLTASRNVTEAGVFHYDLNRLALTVRWTVSRTTPAAPTTARAFLEAHERATRAADIGESYQRLRLDEVSVPVHGVAAELGLHPSRRVQLPRPPTPLPCRRRPFRCGLPARLHGERDGRGIRLVPGRSHDHRCAEEHPRQHLSSSRRRVLPGLSNFFRIHQSRERARHPLW